MSDARGSEIEDIASGDLLRREPFAEMKEENQDVAFTVSPGGGWINYIKHIVLGQFIRIGADYLIPPHPELSNHIRAIKGFDMHGPFKGILTAQPVNRHAGCDMHQVDFGFGLRTASSAVAPERRTFILENLEIDFL